MQIGQPVHLFLSELVIGLALAIVSPYWKWRWWSSRHWRNTELRSVKKQLWVFRVLFGSSICSTSLHSQMAYKSWNTQPGNTASRINTKLSITLGKLPLLEPSYSKVSLNCFCLLSFTLLKECGACSMILIWNNAFFICSLDQLNSKQQLPLLQRSLSLSNLWIEATDLYVRDYLLSITWELQLL